MNNDKWSEKELEDTLRRMPPVKDKQTKDELFHAVKQRADKEAPQRKASKTWFFPAMASAAALLLVVLMIPSFMNTGMFSSGDGPAPADNGGTDTFDTADNNEPAEENNSPSVQNNEENVENTNTVSPDTDGSESSGPEEEAAENENESENGNESDSVNENEGENENENGNENETENADENGSQSPGSNDVDDSENNRNNDSADSLEEASEEDNYFEANDEEYSVEEEESLIVTSAMLEEDEIYYVIPEAADGMSKEEAVVYALQESDPTSGSYFEALEEAVFNGGSSNEITLHFAEENQLASLSSAEHYFMEEVLQETLALYQVSEVNFEAGEEELLIGQLGESEVDLSTLNRGYYPLSSGEGLVSAGTAGEPMTSGTGDPLNFDETLTQMEEVSGQDWYEPAVPDTVEIEDVRYEGKTAYVFYSAEEDSDESFETFKEAVQLTAKYFTLDTVQLVNEEEKEVTLLPVQLP
ncbi:MAG: hypothetical protein EA344_01070 [Alkalicoccus sp.]|nr:MAG: hypothetical protein EA344_01070 [Alkalicoccus sp.]